MSNESSGDLRWDKLPERCPACGAATLTVDSVRGGYDARYECGSILRTKQGKWQALGTCPRAFAVAVRLRAELAELKAAYERSQPVIERLSDENSRLRAEIDAAPWLPA